MNIKEMPGPRTRTPGDKTEQVKCSTAGRIEIQEFLTHNSKAEKELIENLMFRPTKVSSASRIVSPKDFYSRLRGQVYERILDFHEDGRAWNETTLEDSFRGYPDFIEFRDFFDSLLPWIGERVGSNSQIIKECSDRRKLITGIYQANTDLFRYVDLDTVKTNLQKILRRLHDASSR